MVRFTIPELQTEPVVVTQESLEKGMGRTLLLVVAHADDPAIFVGGVVAMWAKAGWHVHCLRVTDDRWDSVGLDEAETIRRNAVEFRQAARVLGIAQVEDLGWRTDVLGDVSRVALRERVIHAIRSIKPYGVVTFDPDSLFHEDNLDHRVLAQAVDEACWTSQFDKHHPEHFADGLAPHGVYERWFFGRTIASVTHVFDTSDMLDVQKQAITCHQTMLANIAQQMALQAKTAGVSSEAILRATQGDYGTLIESILFPGASAKGQPFKLTSAEYMRSSRPNLPR
jgi:LmbE family N-acetylglucosaminyl deacetylase